MAITATAAPVGRLGAVGPNWFTAVMGTGIVATSAAGLAAQVPGRRWFALVVWVLAAAVLLVVATATAAQWRRHPGAARGHLRHPVMSHAYGAPAMALLTVGAGALLVGRDVLGLRAALAVDAVLWTTGTALGLLSAVAVPVVAARRGDYRGPVSATWLIPVVPPMVSATTGAQLLTHVPVGDARTALYVACWVLFAVALVGSGLVLRLLVRGRRRGDRTPAAAIPTLWVVLGPLGQSVTAAVLLGRETGPVLPAGAADVVRLLCLAYALVTWTAAIGWLAVVVAVTARRRFPFSVGWWGFTFPLGTVVTGSSGLAVATGSPVFVLASGVLFAGLLGSWSVVAVGTVRGLRDGSLLRPS